MDSSDLLISKFIILLQKNGYKVLRGELKLKLTVEFLKEINCLLRSDLSSLNIKDKKNKVLFLKNFISKTLKLKINQGSIHGCATSSSSVVSQASSSSGLDQSSSTSKSLTTEVGAKMLVDLTDFNQIKYLELYKVSPSSIVGLSYLRTQLETFICTRSINSICEAIGPNEEKKESLRANYLWNELRYLILQHNQLKSIDNSFICTPWLQFLDLSFNQITAIKKINFDPLTNLKYLNLSFNFLTAVPTFNLATNKKLQILLLRHNQIDNLTGLSEFENLTCCDLSDNIIVDHHQLNSISFFHNLGILNLTGNPISYIPLYRQLICRYLHGNCATDKFILNGQNLSKHEMDIVQYERFNYMSNSCQNRRQNLNVNTPGSSHRNLIQPSSAKRARIREAVICDDNSSPSVVPCKNVKNQLGEVEAAKSCVHLETRKKIEILRERYGEENWLHSQAGSLVQGLLGFNHSSPKNHPSEKQVSSSPEETKSLSIVKVRTLKIERKVSSDVSIASSDVEQLPTPISSKTNSNEKENSPFQISKSNDDIGCKNISDDETKANDNEDDISVITAEDNIGESIEQTEGETLNEPVEVGQETVQELEYCEDHYDLKREDESLLWLIKTVLKDKPEPVNIFLCFDCRKELKEKDMVSGETITRWTVDCIQSCIKVSSDPVTIQLTFDTVQKHRQERTYIMQLSDAQALLQAINEELESRPLSEMNQSAFRCMKCSSLFSREISYAKKSKNISCPFCNSNLIIELDEIPVPRASSPDSPRGLGPSITHKKQLSERTS